MEVSEVRVKLVERANDRLKAFCTITFDNEFVVRDVKIIEGPGGLFVAMPSRKLTDHCPKCHSKNHLRANFCNQCGGKLDPDRSVADAKGRAKLHADMAHPINPACRERIQKEVVREYEGESEAASQPGYRPKSLGFEDDHDEVPEVWAPVGSGRKEHRQPAAGTPGPSRASNQPSGKTGEAPEFGAGIL